jgi:hypothetical protein
MPQYNGVWTLEAQAQAQSNQQWVTDPNFKNTTLLLQADGTGSGSQNQTFLDGSTNNFFITRNGNTTQGSFSPFSQAPGYWSNYFNGSLGTLISSGTPMPTSGDFTVECWIYPVSVSGSFNIIWGGNTSGGLGCAINSTGTITYGRTLVATDGTTTNAVNFNQWNHIAHVRSSGTLKIYINGVLGLTASVSTTYTSSAARLGSDANDTLYYNGYISNFRVTNTAVYTAAFTPQTTPLTAISGTSILTAQSNRFVDNSGNALTFTVGNTTAVQAFGPFAPALQWTPDVVGGSGYFDGTGDYLTAPNNAAFQLGTGDFTLECWYYAQDISLVALFGLWGPTSSNVSWLMYLNGTGNPIWYTSTNGSTQTPSLTSSIAITLNAWNHIAISRVSGTTTVYVNGVSGGNTSTVVSLFAATSVFTIGYNPAGTTDNVLGYLSNIRIVKGSAVYTAAFTPPTAPLTAITNTSLLLNFTNAGIYDGKMGNVLETVGNAQVATSPVKYGSGSMAFDGSGDYLVLNPATTDLYAFGSGDWTIEFWVYLNSVSGGQNIYDGRPISTATTQPVIYMNSAVITYYTNASDRITGSTLSTSQWYHIAVARSGTSTKMFVNGTQSGSTYTDSTVYTNTSQRPIIGASGFTLSTNVLNGYIDDLRITKGVCRYFANFTPPQQALPRQ